MTSAVTERLRLGIDLDGVVADFNGGWMARYNLEFGTVLTAADVHTWEGLHELTHFETMDEFWTWAQLGATSFFRDLPVFQGAIETMVDLAREHRIVIISSKFDWSIPDTLEWMGQHRIPAREIHFVWDKTSVPCDVYLEDAPHNIDALVSGHPGALVCRMVRPWNTAVAGAVDITDWPSFAASVREWERSHQPIEDAGLPRS
jgi:5'(3')-deoxyribonucleotidase